jgi:tripartite-type tricarboxylate transporter receptor subunit TctC
MAGIRNPWLSRALIACAALTISTAANAQTLKSGALSLVVPFASGGPSDVAGRILAQGMAETLGQAVVVENPVGAGGTVGSLRVSRSTPDGSHFGLGNKDFTPLGLAVESPRVIIVPKTLPANTLPEFIAYLKANQDKIQFASAGAGSASHVSCILLNAMLGVNITHVPYRGLGPAMQDLIAGRVQYICDSVSTSKPQIEGNQVKAVATTGLKRSPALPDIPTAKEQGLNFDVLTWQGLFLAKDTPAPIVTQLSQAMSKALDLPSVRGRFEALGEEVPAADRRSPAYFKQFVAGEIARWSGPIKASGVTVE